MMARLKYLFMTLVVALMAAGAGWGYMQLMEIPLSTVEVRGEQWAQAADIEQLLAVDTTLSLYELDPVLLADRAERSPWVATADVARLPSGRLVVDIVEREPVALILDPNGVPAYFVDRNGYRMPLREDAVYDVPLVRGLGETYHPMTPVQHAALTKVLFELPVRPSRLRDSISEIVVEGAGLSFWIAPEPGSRAVRVLLGDTQVDRRLDVLTAFMDQDALNRPDKLLQNVDLRFENQIVVRPGAPATTFSSR